jgi:hypothetical protein
MGLDPGRPCSGLSDSILTLRHDIWGCSPSIDKVQDVTTNASTDQSREAGPKAEAGDGQAETRKPLTPEAQRALAEAEERRRQRETQASGGKQPKELGGRDGPDPARYGDWENGGIVSDF